MRVIRIEVEPFEEASERRRNLVLTLKSKRTELESQQPTGLAYFEQYGDLAFSLSRTLDEVKQRRTLILFGRLKIPLPTKVTDSRIPGVNF